MDCSRCKNRPYCQELCEYAEDYAGQDNIKQYEPTFTMLQCDKGQVPDSLNAWNFSTRNNLFVIYELFFYDKKPVKEISNITYLSQAYIYRTIKQFKNKTRRTHPKNRR